MTILANNHLDCLGSVTGCTSTLSGDLIYMGKTMIGGRIQGLTLDCITYPRLQFASIFGDDTRHFGRINRVYGDQTYQEGLYVTDSDSITLTTPANKATLENHPTEISTSSKAIATVGYCQSKFGKVKTVNNTSPDANGNVTI